MKEELDIVMRQLKSGKLKKGDILNSKNLTSKGRDELKCKIGLNCLEELGDGIIRIVEGVADIINNFK